jgi:hypothetical protein
MCACAATVTGTHSSHRAARTRWGGRQQKKGSPAVPKLRHPIKNVRLAAMAQKIRQPMKDVRLSIEKNLYCISYV